jgi:hypothetical protein
MDDTGMITFREANATLYSFLVNYPGYKRPGLGTTKSHVVRNGQYICTTTRYEHHATDGIEDGRVLNLSFDVYRVDYDKPFNKINAQYGAALAGHLEHVWGISNSTKQLHLYTLQWVKNGHEIEYLSYIPRRPQDRLRRAHLFTPTFALAYWVAMGRKNRRAVVDLGYWSNLGFSDFRRGIMSCDPAPDKTMF